MRIKIAVLGSIGLVSCLISPRVFANPVGGSVVGGNSSATIAGEGTSVVTINQNQSRSIINWNAFSINAGEITKFIQPSDTAAVLNRVLSPNPSLIYGTLQANGRVFLVNPAGIMVGAGGVVDTRGFLASTFDIGNEAFQAASKLTLAGPSTASVRNEGTIRALGGDVFLIANSVENFGKIEASGTVGLAAGSQIVLAQVGEERVTIQPGNANSAGQGTGINNQGQIQAATAELKAAGGNMYALAINNGGAIRASGFVNEGGRIYLRASGGNIQNSGTLSAGSVGGPGGSVVVDGGHNAGTPATVINSGSIEAASAVGQGGSVSLLGDYVGVVDQGRIDVSGSTGGGTVLIGGDYRGGNPAIQNALRTYVGPEATINADALDHGNGGKVIVWSDEVTRFGGVISARGGAQGGNGGFAEVSGKDSLLFRGTVDLRAEHGSAGNLLLDPHNILISTNGSSLGTNWTIIAFSNSPSADATITPSDLSNQLFLASVTLQANNNIIYAGGVAITNGTGSSLTNQAGGSILLSNGVAIILTNGGFFSATFNDTNANAAFRDSGQAVFWMATNTTISAPGGIYIGAGTQNANSGGPASVDANTGDVTLGKLLTTPNTNGLAGGNIVVAITNGALGKNIFVNDTIDASGSENKLTSGPPSGKNGGTGGTITLIASGSIIHQGTILANGGKADASGANGGGAGNILLIATNGIVLAGNVSVLGGTPGSSGAVGTNGVISLSGFSGGVTQTNGALSAADLVLLGSGTFSLTNPANNIGLVAANVNGPFTLVNGTNLTVGTVWGVSGISNANQSIQVSTVNGSLVVTTNVSAGLSTVTLIAGSSSNDNPLTITNGAAVTGLGGVTLVADHLGIDGLSSVNAGSNTVFIHPFETGTTIRLGGADAASTLGLSVGDLTNIFAGTLHIGTADNYPIIVASSLTFTNDLVLQTINGIALNNNLNAANYNVTFDQATGLTGNGLVTASTLNLLGSGQVGSGGLPLQSAAGTVSLGKSGGATFLTNSMGLNLQGSTPGQLNVSANGNITQTNALSVGGPLTLNAGANDILLTNAANNLSQVTASSVNGSLVTSNSLALINSSFTNNLTISVPGNLNVTNTQVGHDALLYAGTNLILSGMTVSNNLGSAATNGISLLTGNSIVGGLTNVSGDSISLVTTNYIGGGANLWAATNGVLTNVVIGGDLALTAKSGNNNLAGVTLGGSGNVTNGGSINLSLVKVGTNLLVQSGGTVSQTGGIRVSNNLEIVTAGNAGVNVLLGNLTNYIGQALLVTNGSGWVRDLSLANAVSGAFTNLSFPNVLSNLSLSFPNSAITLGGVSVSNALTVLSGGDITQSNSIIVGGTATFNATTNYNVTLADPNNDFNAVSLVASNATVTDKNDLTLAASQIRSNLTVTAGGNIFENGALVVGGDSRFTLPTSGTSLRLGNQTNDFAGSVTVVGILANLDLRNIATNASAPVGFASATNVTLTFDNSGITFDNTTIYSNLTVTVGGNIGQSNGTSLVVGGKASLAAPNFDITLTNAANDFNELALIAKNASVADANSLKLDAPTLVTGNLTVSTVGDLSQNGPVTVGGLTTLLATNANINLGNTANDFHTVSLVASNATLADVNALDLGTTLVGNNLTVTAGTDLTQSGVVTVGGLAALSANRNIILADGNNDFHLISLVASNATVADLNTLGIGATTITSNLTLIVGADITNYGSVMVGGLATLLATNGNVNLALPYTNDFNLVSIDAKNASVWDLNAINLASALVSTNLIVVAGGDISQTGPLTVGGISGFGLTKDGASVLLGSQPNNLAGPVEFATTAGVNLHEIQLRNVSTNAALPIIFAGFAVTNVTLEYDNAGIAFASPFSVISNLTLIMGGDITQSNAAPLTVGGVASLWATNHNITLNSVSNDFNTVSLVGNNAVLTNLSALDIGASRLTGTLTLTAGGAISQSGPLFVGATSQLSAPGNITLNNVGNDFVGLVTVANGQAVTLVDLNNLTVGGISSSLSAHANGGDLTLAGYTTTGALAAQASGNILQTGTLLVGTTSSLNAGGNITLNNPANDLVGPVTIVNGQAVNLADVNTLTVGGASASLAARAFAGDLVLAGYTTTGTLAAQASGNILQTGTLLVGTTSSLNAGGNITLNNAGNDFVGPVTVANGQAVNLVDLNSLTVGGASASLAAQALAGDLTLAGYTTTGSLVAQASGNVLQTGVLLVGTTSSLGAGGNITLNNAANDFVGPVTIVNGQAVNLADINTLTVGGASASLAARAFAGDLVLAGYTTTGALAAQASGNILQTGVLLVGTTSSLNGAGNITLNNAGNDFVGPVTVVNGQAVNLVDLNSLTVGGASASLAAQALAGDLTLAGYTTTGSLAALAGGNVLQTGVLLVGTTSSLGAGGNITLNNAANDFAGPVTVVKGQTVSLVDVNSLTVSGTSGNLTAHATAGDLTLAGYATTNALVAQATGNILQTGLLLVGTTSSLNAGGNITLNNAGNDFVGPVTVINGQAVNLVDVNSLTVGGSSASLSALANAGDLTLAGYTTTGALAAQASGNILQTGALLVGTTSSLNAGGNITLNNAANDFGGLVTVVKGQTVNLVDVNSLTVGGTSGNLTAHANVGDLTLAGYTTTGSLAAQASGNISQTGTVALLVGTTSSLNAGGNITLNNAANDFVGPVTVVNGQAVNLADVNSLTVGGTSGSLVAHANAGDLTLAGYTTTGSLAAQASGNISQTGTVALLVGTTSSLNAGGTITLNNAGNDFVGPVTVVNGQAVNLVDVNSLTVGGTSGGLVARANAGDLTLAGYTTTGSLAAQASGNILQTGVPLIIGTTSSLNAGGNITLNNAANDFVGPVTVVNGQAVSLVDVNSLQVGGTSGSLTAHASGGDLTFAGYTTTGSLAAQASGHILQTNALVVGTTSSLNAGGNITLNNSGNDFVGPVTVVNGQAVNLVDVNSLTVGGTSASLAAQALAGDLTLAGYTTTGALAAQASGNILQTGALLVGTTSSLNAGGNITLNNAANDFVGQVTVVKGQTVDLVDVNSLTVSGTSSSLTAHANAGDLTLAGYATTNALVAQASGNILQTGTLLVGTTSSLNAGGNITLTNAANDFGGLVTVLNGQAVSLADTNSLTVGGTSGSLTAHANGGDLTLAGYTTTGALAAQASGNILQTGALLVGTTSSLNAGGNITLNNVANDFVGPVSVVNGQAVQLTDLNGLTVGGTSASLTALANGGDLTLAGYTTTGSLAAQASGNILQTGTLLVGTTSSLNAAGDITLNNPANDFGGAVTIGNGQTVQLSDINSLTVGGSSANLTAHANGGDLILAGYTTTGALTNQASGNIAQSGTLHVGTAASFNAGGNITLADNANSFGTVALASTTGNSVRVSQTNSMLLENVTATNATVILTSATGSIAQDAATSLVAKELAANAVTGVSFPNGNHIQNLAGAVSGPGNFEFKDLDALTVGTVGGVVGITATAPGSRVTLDADQIGITSSGISAGPNMVLLQPVSSTGNLMLSGPYAAPSTPLNYSGLNNVRAATLQIGNDGAFSGNISIAQTIALTNRSNVPYQPTPVSVATNDVTTLSLQTHGGSISNILTAGSWAVVNVPRLSLVASNAVLFGSLANSSDVSFLAWRTGSPIEFIDANTLDLLWVNTALIGANQAPSGHDIDYQPIDGVFGASPISGNQILFNGGGVPAQQFANSLVPFNNVELPMSKLTLSAVSVDFNLKAYGARIDALLPGAIWRSFAQMPFPAQTPLEDQVKPEAASKWVRGYLGISGSTGSPQQSAY